MSKMFQKASCPNCPIFTPFESLCNNILQSCEQLSTNWSGHSIRGSSGIAFSLSVWFDSPSSSSSSSDSSFCSTIETLLTNYLWALMNQRTLILEAGSESFLKSILVISNNLRRPWVSAVTILLFVESAFTAVNWFLRDQPSKPMLYLFLYCFGGYLLVSALRVLSSSFSYSSFYSSGSGIGSWNFTPKSCPACILNSGGFWDWISSKSQNLRI